VLRSNAFIVTSGGIGTTLELMMVWQLLQVRRLYDTPFILLGDMWPELVGWARNHMVGRGLADSGDMGLPHCVRSVEEAISIIADHHHRWEEQKKKEEER
jgi:predicted Rossmann-fold nucleotide-binding protein